MVSDKATKADEFEAAIRSAFSEAMATCRRLKPRMVTGDMSAAREFGTACGKLMGEAGMTEEEGKHYTQRIMAMVIAEPQA